MDPNKDERQKAVETTSIRQFNCSYLNYSVTPQFTTTIKLLKVVVLTVSRPPATLSWYLTGIFLAHILWYNTLVSKLVEGWQLWGRREPTTPSFWVSYRIPVQRIGWPFQSLSATPVSRLEAMAAVNCHHHCQYSPLYTWFFANAWCILNSCRFTYVFTTANRPHSPALVFANKMCENSLESEQEFCPTVLVRPRVVPRFIDSMIS